MSALFSRLADHPQGLANHQQHRLHEGQSQEMLVHPDHADFVLVQGRFGETLSDVWLFQNDAKCFSISRWVTKRKPKHTTVRPRRHIFIELIANNE